MIDYELALKLKNAGFPQKERSIIVGNEDNFIPDPTHLDQYLYVPTLSELIEACGKDFMLTNERGKWDAWSGSENDFVRMGEAGAKYECQGSTPEESVANLYLALNPHT